ncbi:PREDICTED: multidrug resistance-associated protein 4-like isoform X1 [Ceratosolen solmsi marchali]|uniref:Multidrug resistance-associated protein 4-like isoform X1 n=1 Tax=Ceratosolen solmsi marchali TaxID=326594 RepID=A0AAJ7E262_9HYME|nr:PREDICTED: multidrug resistance-associated protein 4-like isoform X1 [Ceratosolen solmsi marchali]
MDVSTSCANANPRLSANIVSKLLFCWLNPLFWYGRKHDIQAKDLHTALPNDLSEPLGNQLEKYWKREMDNFHKTKKKPSLLRAIRKTFGWSYLQYATHILFLAIVIRILQPLILGVLIYHFDPCSTTTTLDAYLLASGVILMAILQAIIGHHSNFGQLEIGMRVRIACSSLVYRKITRLSCSAASQATGGLITNLLSNDVARFEQLFLFLHYIWVMPLQGAVIAYLIWRHVGAASLAGVLLMVLQTIPVQAYCAKIMSKLRSKIATRTDERVLLMSEIINGIRVIKMYTWEKPFEKLVSFTRKLEVDVLTVASYLRAINLASFVFTERTTLFITIVAFVLQGYTISADKVFTMAQYFNILQLSMAILYPRAVGCAAEARISIKRIEKFLLLEEVESNTKDLIVNNDNTSILVKNVNASWSEKSIANTLHDINIVVPQKKLFAVVGPVGAGKSSVLKLILGELRAASGKLQLHGSMSYASQEPWLFNGSIRSNILFGAPYDEEKYQVVTRACALVKDFEQLPHGDKSLVGERGGSLSGGQCARINLARAVYRDADIYLLDDPLSAVDTRVGKSLFEDCINGYLKDKTRILVTHQIQYLKQADAIILLNNGKVEFQGTFLNFSKNESYIRHLPSSSEMEKTLVEEPEIVENGQMALVLNSKIEENEDNNEPQEVEELMAKGNVAKSLYWNYFKAGGSYFILSYLVISFILAQLATSGCDFWLGFWTRKEEERLRNFIIDTNSSSCMTTQMIENMENTWFYKKYKLYLNISTTVFIYTILIVGSIVMSTVKNILFCKVCMNASKTLHNAMFSALLKAPMRFFDVNPSGRILNRFSKDTGAVDETLPMAMLEAFQIFSVMIGIMMQVLIINWWTIFPMLVMGFLYLKIRNLYLASAQDIKRLEGNAKSPVFSHANTSFLGLLTIRSCGAQAMTCKEFDILQDVHTAAYSLILSTSTAFGFWLDIVSITFVAFVTYSFIVIDSNDFFNGKPFAGNVGLAISQSLILCGMLQYGMRQTAEMMAQMTSVERMFQFTELEKEGPFESEPGKKPNKSWPRKGRIQFKEVYLKYSAENEPVLKNLTFVVEPGMKIGIVGRTGAGKSSLITALFRLSQIDGSLLIDDVDISKIGLNDLRNKISIVPQEPILFSATLRDNLDPFHESDDATLWLALQEVELDKIFASLEHAVTRGGGNMSAGQRQLLCLARAIVKRNKILILDEATANVDHITDSLIQKTIRVNFKDCTVLTIAHRLNTIMDCDKLLVMENGQAVEYDHPHNLLQCNDGYLAQMVQQTGNNMAQHLKEIAEKAFNKDLRTSSIDLVSDDENNKSAIVKK